MKGPSGSPTCHASQTFIFLLFSLSHEKKKGKSRSDQRRDRMYCNSTRSTLFHPLKSYFKRTANKWTNKIAWGLVAAIFPPRKEKKKIGRPIAKAYPETHSPGRSSRSWDLLWEREKDLGYCFFFIESRSRGLDTRSPLPKGTPSSVESHGNNQTYNPRMWKSPEASPWPEHRHMS